MTGTFSGVTGSLIADAPLPFLRSGYAYVLTVNIGGQSVTSPALNNVADMMSWAQTNYSSLGTWANGKDLLIVYVNAGYNDVALTVGLQLRGGDFDSRDFDGRDFYTD